MRRSIRSSLFLLVAPFALTFTLVAWVVHSKIGPWLSRPLIADCGDKGYAEWVCQLQAGILPWLFLGVGILVLLSVTALLSLGLFRAHLRELQQDILDFQKGQRTTLAADAPAEISPLVKLLSRILQAGAGGPDARAASYGGETEAPLHGDRPQPLDGPAALAGEHKKGPASIAPTRPATEIAADRTGASRPEPRQKPAPHPEPAPAPSRAPEPPPTPEEEDLEVSLEELDADIEKALQEEPASPPETPEDPAAAAPQDKTPSAPQSPPAQGPSPSDRPPDPAAARGNRNLSFPARKCRKLIAMLGHRYPDVNFELITDVAESDPWSVREAELTEIFGHLLDNAGKWAESQVNIFLAIKGNMLVFGVADDGPGMDQELMSKLGEANFPGGADGPAGDGLVTVRRALDAHGGSLAFDRSRLGGLEAIAAIPGSPVPRHVGARGAYH